MDNLDDFPPPPAYSEQEFDQKTAHALTLSAHHPPSNRQNEDTWEVWDEAVFRANAAGATTRTSNQGPSAGSSSAEPGASSSRRPLPTPGRPTSGLPPVQPLRIHKRNKSSGDAGSGLPLQSKGQEAAAHKVRDPDEPSHDFSPPPPFQAVETPNDNVVTLNYNPADSLPPSPLMPTIPEHQSPQSPQQAQQFPSQIYPQQTYPQQTYPQQTFSPQQTPIQQSFPSQPYSQPEVVPHNPVVNIYPQRIGTPQSVSARASPSHFYQQQSTPRTFTPPVVQQQQPPKPQFVPSVMTSIPPLQNRANNNNYEPPTMLTFDPSAFYNAAVSAHVPTSLGASKPRQSQYMPSGTIPSNYAQSAHQPRVIQSTLYPPAQLRPAQSTTQLRPQTTYNFPMQPSVPSSGWNSNMAQTPHRWATSEPDFGGS